MAVSDLVYIDETGYHFADYPAFLQFFQDSYRANYGADIYIEPDSQDGQQLAVLAKAAYDVAALGASIYNSFSPVTAQGVGLSRNVKINGLVRQSATFSTVDLTIVGQSGTVLGVVGAPAVAIDTLDQKWNLPIGTVIPGGGTITITATAQEMGAIQAAVNTVNRIFTPTRGWQTVNNSTAASAGAAVESDAALRARQAVSTANPSLTVLDGTVGGVANLPGVTDVRGYENDTDTTDSNGLPEHSISIVVEGGDVTEICEMIQLHKAPGCYTYGDTSEIVFDPHGIPNTIRFQRPTPVTILVQVDIDVGTGWSADYEALIAEAVASYINSIGIGNDVLFTKLYIPAYLQNTPAFGTFDINSIEIAADPGPVTDANVPIDWDELAVCDATTDVTIVT